jgi:transposase
MNRLNVSLQHSITTLAAHGWSHRRIARELDIHRETVGKYLRGSDPKPAKVLTGFEPDPTAKPAIALTGSLAAGRSSLCVPLQGVIESAVQAGLSAQRIYQDLICDHAFTGGYHSVQRFVRQLLQTQPVPFVRMEVAPGAEAQVDFGQGAWVLVAGKRKRPHLFRIVLSHSRKGYSEVVWQQTTESFIRCLENAFRYFGGVPRTLIIDNLRAAVTRADWYDPELNAKVEEFCRHYPRLAWTVGTGAKASGQSAGTGGANRLASRHLAAAGLARADFRDTRGMHKGGSFFTQAVE